MLNGLLSISQCRYSNRAMTIIKPASITFCLHTVDIFIVTRNLYQEINNNKIFTVKTYQFELWKNRGELSEEA